MNSKVIKIKNLFVARSHSICSSSFIVGVTANANCYVIMGVVELMTANALQTVAGVTIKRRPLAYVLCDVGACGRRSAPVTVMTKPETKNR